MRSWLGNRLRGTSISVPHGIEEESAAMHDALQAAAYMMDDDLELADEKLKDGDSAFHKTGLGVVGFMRAVLGMEKDAMADAQARLVDAENTAYESYNRVKNHPELGRSKIYSVGAEYLLCQAQVQLMAAVVGVLTESLGAALASFYKLRKAYLALEVIMAEQTKYEESFKSSQIEEKEKEKEKAGEAETPRANGTLSPATDEEDWFDVAETPGLISRSTGTPRAATGSAPVDALADALEGTKIDEKHDGTAALSRASTQILDGPEKHLFNTVVDEFIHSNSNLCFGLLLIMLSMLPPSFKPLVQMVGLKGDRKRGISLLWQATKFENLNGAFAGLVLLGYYNNFISFCDIVPSTGSGAYPMERCKALLQNYRVRYPKSCFWILEESRMLTSEKDLHSAYNLLKSMPPSKLKQITALQCFELSMNGMFTHKYESCSESFIKMIKLNNWSHGLYYYIAACARIESYRELEHTDPQAAADEKKLALKYLEEVPKLVGKKKIIGRQLPFDVFIGRKLQKWAARAKEHDVDLVDATGVSPLSEMSYFWNGYKRMRPENLTKALERLSWSTSDSPKVAWSEESVDEKGMHALLTATALRNLGKTEEARSMLQEQVLGLDKAVFKGGFRENWVPPCANYEMGVSYWNDYALTDSDSDLKNSLKYLDAVAAWESFDLDARLGVRIKTGQTTVSSTTKQRSNET